MASSAINEQRRKEDLELLALFDSDYPQDLSSFQSSFSHIMPMMEISVTSKSQVFPGQRESVNVDNWTADLDDETLAYIDEIIAKDAESSSRTACPMPASGEKDPAFCFPRRYKCPMCPKEFLSKVTMRKHGRRHILKQIRCPCGFRSQSPVQQQKHYLYHHVGVPKHKFLASF